MKTTSTKFEATKLEALMFTLCQLVNEFEERLDEDLDTHYLQMSIIKKAIEIKEEYK
jgi:hypothetical protein